MFSIQHHHYLGGGSGGINLSGNSDTDGYDFTKNENAARWRGLFTPSLKKVLEQVHPRLTAKEDALLYVETLCLRLLAMLCAKPLPHSVQDLEEKVNKSFPTPIDQWALNEAKEIINSKKRKSVLPTDRVHSLLQKDVLQYKIDSSVSVFLVAVLEYISADILKMAGDYVCKIEHCEITKEDIEVVMNADRVLMDMFNQSDIKSWVLPSTLSTLPTTRTSTTYEDVVKELIHDEKQYQRDLHMIIRVFREELVKIVRDPKELEPIFSNIMDIYELTVTLLGSLEDVIEMSQEQSAPCVGSCFEELAEAEEFDVYTKYAQQVTSQAARDALNTLLAKPDALSLISAGHGFRDAVKYYLPKLLLVPIWHCFVYFDYTKLFMDLSPSQDDVESFEQVQGLLRPLRCNLENIMASLPQESMVPMSSRVRRQLAIERTRELQIKVEHWDKDVGQNCNEFIREDSLGKLGSGKRIAERKVFLFDGLMVLCKANTKKQTPSAGAPAYDYRLKEKFFMRRVEINDRADTDELKNSFEIAPRVQPPIILAAKNSHHKNDWMADLIMVNTKSMLDRTLDSILLDIEKRHPLRMPAPEIYKFAIPDSNENIVLEERESIGVPLIKGATLRKLVERLTYHIYADPMFVRTFLTTYRSFCTPQQLIELLIERFDIPDPSLVYQDNQLNSSNIDKESFTNCETEKLLKNAQREDWKRYRKEYVQPVQFRVLNVFRHWVDHHFYDFERDATLLNQLMGFLNNVNGKSMRKWVDSVLKIVQRKKEQEKSNKKIVYAYGHDPPPIEYHLNVPDAEITLLTLHPLELARQLTLLEFELYKNVKPSELVGSPWTKKDKELKSPHLLKIMKHTTNVSRWIEKSIIEAENYEERVAIVTRAIEVMMVMLELNNFNGILSICASMGSAAVFRLKLTFQSLPARYEKFLEECMDMHDGHLKKYQERLRSINPPCVPFFGRYLTNILHLEEGNPDFLPNTELINFSKRRKVSEIIGEIQQYQNQPYCLKEEPKIRHFLESLDPFKGMTEAEISNFMYNESLRIEPRGCKQPPKFPRKWPTMPLKSPGIKPRRQNNSNSSSSNSNNNSKLSVSASAATSSNSGDITGDQSPTVAQRVSQDSVFAIVQIPERKCATWVSGVSAITGASIGVCSTPLYKVNPEGQHGDEVPNLPKKPAAHVWTTIPTATTPTNNNANNNNNNNNANANANAVNESLSPVMPEQNAIIQSPVLQAAPPATLPRCYDQSAIWHDEQLLSSMSNNCSSNINPQTSTTDTDALPLSPLPKVVVSPRHEASGNLSPFHASSSRTNSIVVATNNTHFSPTQTHSIASAIDVNTLVDLAPKHVEIIYNNQATAAALAFATATSTVPISPHVNVPLSSSIVYRAVPPPLPPRPRERTDSCNEIAQKRQSSGAPILPPRDDELSPPPIPPRQKHSNICNTNTQPKEFEGRNSLQLPHTSSIMIRRNSAIEKRAAAAQVNHVNASSAKTAMSISPPSQHHNVLASETQHDDQQQQQQQQSQAISPALSSSTTTSPMTPMTPISPHVPSAGYQVSSESYHHHQQQHLHQHPHQQQYQHQHHHHHQHVHQQQQTRLKPSNLQHHGYQLQQQKPQAQLPHAYFQQQQQQQQQVPASIPPRSSPKEYFALLSDGSGGSSGTPKLPPKPSLSANNIYNNPDKGTMFLYPSTNQE